MHVSIRDIILQNLLVSEYNQYNLKIPEYKKVQQISNWIIENVFEYLKKHI